MIDYYVILEISEFSNPEEIKNAYRRLALQWHPDRNKSTGASEKFIKIKEAYEILRNPDKRAKYDQLLYAYRKTGPAQQKGADQSKDSTKKSNRDLNDLNDLREQFRKWRDEATAEGVKQASMRFKEFAQSIGATVSAGANGLMDLLVYLFMLWLGPGMLIYMLWGFISDPKSFYHLSFLRWIGLLALFALCMGITAFVIIGAHFKLKEMNSENGRK